MNLKPSDNPQSILFINIIVNCLIGTVKWLGGIYGGSQALIADALETSSDVFSSILLLIGYKKSIQPADGNHPYGHGKLEAVISFIIGLALLLSVGLIIYQSINTLLLPDKTIPANYTLYIIIGVIITKEVLYRLFNRLSKKNNSSLFHHEALHHRSDAFSSLVSLIGVGISLIPGGNFWWGDQLAAIVASGIITFNAYTIIRSSLSEIMDEQINPEVQLLVEQTADEMALISSYEKCYVRKSGNFFYCDIHIRVKADLTVKEGHDISHELKDKVQAKNQFIADVHIHIEPEFN